VNKNRGMKYKVHVYEGFGDSHDKYFKTLTAARRYQEKMWKLGGPRHFVTVLELVPVWKEI
jgi:hypothetical protein